MKRAVGVALAALLFLSGCGMLPGYPTAAPATPAPTSAPTAEVTPVLTQFYCPSANQAALKAYNDALVAIADDDNQAAEEHFLKAVELDPNFCDAMDNLAGLLRSQDRLEEAAAWLEKSLAVNPRNGPSLANLGRIYTILLQPDKAAAAYLKLTELEPDNPVGYYGLGMAYFVGQDYELASLSLAKAEPLLAQEKSPYVTDARYMLGMSLFYLQQLDQALPYLLTVYQELPDDGSLNYTIGLCYLYGTQPDGKLAAQYIDKAAQLGIEIPAETRTDLAALGE
ncbi:MAG: tetratricopeptide repeat protein [Anaerolineae bacterium]